MYRLVSNIRRSLEGNKIIDHSDLTPGFNGLGKGNCMMRRESFKFWFWARLILEILRYRASLDKTS